MKNCFKTKIINFFQKLWAPFSYLLEIYFPFSDPLEKTQYHDYKINNSISIFDSYIHKLLILPTFLYFMSSFTIETINKKFQFINLFNAFFYLVVIKFFLTQLHLCKKYIFSCKDHEKLQKRNKYRNLFVAFLITGGMPIWYEILGYNLTQNNLFPKNFDVFHRAELYFLFLVSLYIMIENLFVVSGSLLLIHTYSIVRNHLTKYYDLAELLKEILYAFYIVFLWITFLSFNQKNATELFYFEPKK